jgi:hypothetical protein
MAHIRKLIRDDITTTLTGLTTTGSNIYQTRVYPLADDKLPGLAIYTSSESTEYATINPPRTQIRTLTVSVEIYVRGLTGYDNTLDQIALEIEEALYTDLTRGGYAKETRVTGFEAEFSGEGDEPVAYATMSVEVDYMTLENDLETSV